MSRSGALDDGEMQSEMNKMVAFISQEAREKAREIQVKADEEFAIEKAKIVHQESLAIDAQFEKKKKQAEVSWKISQSTALNTSRLEVLRAREEHLQSLFDDARAKIKALAGEHGKYDEVLEGLILEVLLILLSPQITLIHKPSETELVKSSATKALAKYKDVSGRTTDITFEASLGEDSAGGVVGTKMGGKIRVDDTLDARLEILEQTMLPDIRTELFGKNPNRTFYS